MNTYIKSISRRGETFEDKEKGLPVAYLGRTMINHGDDFEADSEFGNCLIAMGRANERVANLQEQYVANASAHWLEGLERSLAMMKEYQVRLFYPLPTLSVGCSTRLRIRPFSSGMFHTSNLFLDRTQEA